jgi:hypothetical protein
VTLKVAPPPADCLAPILSREAIAFVAELHDRFGARRTKLLQARAAPRRIGKSIRGCPRDVSWNAPLGAMQPRRSVALAVMSHREPQLVENDPMLNSWTAAATMGAPRMYHSAALLLPDGRVVAADYIVLTD